MGGGAVEGARRPFPGGARGFWEAAIHMLVVSIRAPDRRPDGDSYLGIPLGPLDGCITCLNMLLIIGCIATGGGMLLLAIPFWLLLALVSVVAQHYLLKGGDATPEQAAEAFVAKLETIKPELQEFSGIDGMPAIHRADVVARLEVVLRRNRMLFLETNPVYYGDELKEGPWCHR